MIGRTDIINVGYFICRIVPSPDYLGFGTDSFISVSDCLTDHEPQPSLCHGWKPRGDDKDYISRFADTETYIRMSEEMNELLEKRLFLVDGCFLRKEDAIHFYKDYFDSPDNILVSVTTEEYYRSYLGEDFANCSSTSADTEGEFLGYDIIGRDDWVFHSFLCNSLQKELPDVRFNSFGLIANPFDEVKRMAAAIDGKGEPVDWLPAEIRRVL